MSATTKQLLSKAQDDLDRLSALKQQIKYNFPGSTEQERDAVLDIIVAVCQRGENWSKHLREKLIQEL